MFQIVYRIRSYISYNVIIERTILFLGYHRPRTQDEGTLSGRSAVTKWAPGFRTAWFHDLTPGRLRPMNSLSADQEHNSHEWSQAPEGNSTSINGT